MHLPHRRAGRRRTFWAASRSVGLAVVLAIVAGLSPQGGARAAQALTPDPAGCAPYSSLSENLVLTSDGRLTIPPSRVWQLPDDPTWRENPFGDKHWVIRYQSLRYVEHLIAAWCAGAEEALLDRAVFLLRDWLANNPIGAAAKWAWYDHPVAWRTFVFTRAARLLPDEAWLPAAIAAHGEWLAAYKGVGNHALNAYRGLLQAGCYLARQDWIDLAARRMGNLLKRSVDSQGVTNEQAIAYQEYNYRIYNEARLELLACGQPESTYIHRVALMPNMLAHATLPNGEYEMLGNTFRKRAMIVPGTWLEFSATRGASGSRPPSTDALFKAGFAFVRSGWGDKVAYEDEVMLSVRYGPGRAFHGHDEGAALTLYGFGSRVLLDSGKNSFQGTRPWTPYFVGRAAHNVVTVDGLKYRKSKPTTMTPVLGERSAFFALANGGYYGVTNRRTILYSRSGRYVVVDDQLTATEKQTFRQGWHLAEDADPLASSGRVVTRGPSGNVAIIQLAPGGTTRVVKGSTSPTQGWLTYEYQKLIAAPVVEHVRRGTYVRYITLLVPFRGDLAASGRIVQQWSDGYQVDVTVNGRTERVTVRGTDVKVRDVISLSPTPQGGDAGLSTTTTRRSYLAI